jgi:TolA-binding protein
MENERAELNTNQPSPEEMVQILSQTVIQQDTQIKMLKEELAKSKEAFQKCEAQLADAEKTIAFLKEEQSKPCETQEAECSIINRGINRYLDHELEYAESKIRELRHHLADYPEDSYAQVDLQNSLLHLNYLKAMMRRFLMY